MSGDLVPAPIISDLTSGGIDCIAIISLGEKTDGALDDLNLDDQVIPQLRSLVASVRNTKWEKMLTSSEWGLSPQEASFLAKALNEDLTPGYRRNNTVGINDEGEGLLLQSGTSFREVGSPIYPQFKPNISFDSLVWRFSMRLRRSFFSYSWRQSFPILLISKLVLFGNYL